MILPLQPLVTMTITSPALAARSILSVAWPRQALWCAMVLIVALNSIIYSLQEILVPLPSEVAFPRLSPLGYFTVVLVLQVVFIFALQASSRWLGGQGRMEGLLAVVVWLQFLQVVLQLAMTLLFLVAPSIAGLLNLAATLFGLLVFASFINEVHQLQSNWRAFGALMMASIIIALALSFLLGLAGPSFLGLSANV